MECRILVRCMAWRLLWLSLTERGCAVDSDLCFPFPFIDVDYSFDYYNSTHSKVFIHPRCADGQPKIVSVDINYKCVSSNQAASKRGDACYGTKTIPKLSLQCNTVSRHLYFVIPMVLVGQLLSNDFLSKCPCGHFRTVNTEPCDCFLCHLIHVLNDTLF